MMMRAVFFDMDNTIFNTSEVAPKAYEIALNEVSKMYKLKGDDLFQEWKKIVDTLKNEMNPKKRRFSYSLELLLKEKHLEYNKKLINYIVEIQEDEVIKRLKFTKGSKEFFSEKNPKYYQIIMSESPRHVIYKKLNKFDIRDRFELIVDADMVGSMKPHPLYYDLVYNALDFFPDQGYYVGDDWEKDCAMPAKVGGLGILFGKEDPYSLYSIEDMMELHEIFHIIEG